MVERLKDQKVKSGEIEPEQLDTVDLPEEDKSGSWKVAVLAYSLAAPLVLASPAIYMIYPKSMFKGEICKFVELADVHNDQQECLDTFDDETRDDWIEKAGFRYQAFCLGLFAPPFLLLVEMTMNQIKISWKQLVHQYFFTAFYAFATALWQISTGDAVIFPDKIEWVNYEDIFSNCIEWFLCFAGVQTIAYSLVLLLHHCKADYCCKKSVPIVTYNENKVSDLGSLSRQQNKMD